MTLHRDRRPLLAILLVMALTGISGLGPVARAIQAGEIFSPASGHAQVIAQGVAALPGETAWRAVFHSLDPGSASEIAPGEAGFLLVDTGGVLVDHEDRSAVLAPAEAVFRDERASRLVPVGERPAGVFTIDLVSPDAAEEANGGIPVFASAPFVAPDGARDIDLVRDLLEPGESTTVIGNESPVLVLVTLGTIRAEATDGSSASLRVGEAATFSGDIVLTAEGQAPSTFVAAVIGREAPMTTAAGTPGATPAAQAVGSVQVTVYACPPLVALDEASAGLCLRDPEAVGLELAAIEGETVRDVGPSTERQGLPTWTGLAGGEYVLRAASFKQGFGRFLVRGLEGTDGGGEDGYGAGADGYVIPIGPESSEHALDVFVFVPGDGATPAAEATAEQTGGPTEIPSVIQVETPVPGAEPSPTATPRATSTPRPAPIVTATPRPTESAIVNSTAVARPRQGSIDVRVFGCLDSIETFNLANCAQAVDGFDVRLINEEGEIIGLEEATVNADGSVTWENLPLGTYLFQQPLLLPGTATYYIADRPLADDGTGYIIAIDAEEPVAEGDVFNLPVPPAAPTPVPTPAIAPAAAVDSDGDGIPDADETAVYGTDPANADTDLDGVVDGAEIAAGTNPLVAEETATGGGGGGDSDGDRLADADETAFGTDPNSPDSDGDGYFDGDEVNLGTDPLNASSVPTA
jgi:hypothetical protein